MKVRSRKLKFESRDGLRLHGTLTTPARKVAAVMLLVHGITSDRSEWGIFDRLADEIAKDGVASLRFDFRGHGRSRLRSDRISLGGILSDVISAWETLEREVDADGGRLKRYLLGSSYGGGLAYAAASRLGRTNRVFMLAPVLDYLADLENCAPKWHDELASKDHFHYGDLKLGRALADETFYFDPLAGNSVKGTIFHGTADTDVLFELSREAAARRADLELVPVEGAGHVLNVPDDLELEQEASWAHVRFMIEQVRKRIL